MNNEDYIYYYSNIFLIEDDLIIEDNELKIIDENIYLN